MTTGFVRGSANFSTHGFIPIVFSKQVLAILDVTCAAIKCVNTSFEDEIKKAGDIVRARQFGNMNMNPYTPYTNPIIYQTPQEFYADLVIDQANYWAILVDYMDLQQSDLDVMGGYEDRAAIAVRNTVDANILAIMSAGVSASNIFGAPTIGSVIQLTPENVYSRLSTKPYTALSRSNAFSVPTEAPFMIAQPDVVGVMEDSQRLKTVFLTENGISSDAINSIAKIKEFGHFMVEETTNSPLNAAVPGLTDDYYTVLLGVRYATSFAMQLNNLDEIEKYPLTFGDAMRGLELHGTKVFHPAALAKCYVKV